MLDAALVVRLVPSGGSDRINDQYRFTHCTAVISKEHKATSYKSTSNLQKYRCIDKYCNIMKSLENTTLSNSNLVHSHRSRTVVLSVRIF